MRERCFGANADNRFTIGIVARFHPRKKLKPNEADPKGYDLLFKALAGVSFPNRILALGPSEEGAIDQLRTLAAAAGKNPDDIVFPGFAWDVAPYYRLMDLNVLPSRGEELGLALVEGMAAGICSIGADNGGMLEIIRDGETGMFFKTGDAAALREKILLLAQDSILRSRLARAGSESVRERFNSIRMTREFDSLRSRILRSA